MTVFYISFIILLYGSYSLDENCFQNICFTVGKTNVSYKNALEECKKLNQTLAFISDKSAQLFIQNFINSTNNTFYIGLKYIPKERFVWESNSSLKPDLNWSSNIKEASSESCVYLLNDTMNIGNCSNLRNFICSNSSYINSEIINPNDSCANGFFKYLNKCYKMNLNCNDESKQWNEAQKMCKSFDINSNLIVANSMIEQEFLTALMTKSPQAVWTGLRYSSINKNVFQIWVDENNEMPVYPINFKVNEPNNNQNEKCLMVYHRLSNIGQFNDENCSRYLNFVCQSPLIMQNTNETSISSQNPLFYQGKCKNKYFEFNETCYKVEKTLSSYETANKTCNGKLLYVYDFIDTAFIRSLMALEGVSNVWINVNDKDSISGVMSLQNEIKNMKVEAINETLCYYIDISRKGLIQAISCSDKHSYICYEFLDGHEKEKDDLICPLTWLRVGKKCFAMKMYFSTFENGIQQCEIYNSKIAQLTNIKEAQAIKIQFTDDFWIGLNGKSYLDNKWIDHTKLDYCLIRHTKNINNEIKANPSQFCFIQRSNKKEWDIRKCTDSKTLICEQPASKDDCPQMLNINIDGDCYGMIDINKTWNDAEKYCQSIGGNKSHLASFHSWDQENLLLSKLSFLNKTSRFWIGLRVHNFIERWIDESAINYEQLRHKSSFSEGMSCFSNFKVGRSKTWWRNENCATNLPFLCKLSKKKVVNYIIDENIIKPDYYCPEGFIKHGLGCFKLYEEPLTWRDADDKCKSFVKNHSKVARLARFDNLQEYESVLSSLRGFNGSMIWIGLYKESNLTQLLWLDEKPFQIFKSVINDPQNGENYVAIELSMNPFLNGQWIMQAGIKHFPFLCRIDPYERLDETDNPNAHSFTNISNSICQAPFVEYDKNCYYYNSKKLNFSEADKNCKSVSAELLILDDTFEEHFVRSFLTYRKPVMKRSWIGLNVNSVNILQNWNTTSGSRVYYTHWSQLGSYQNSNTYLYDNPKSKIYGCYALRHEENMINDNGMVRAHCDVQLPSICKRTLSGNHEIMNSENSCAKSINGTYYHLDVRKTDNGELCVRWDIVMNSNPFSYHLNTKLISSIPFNKDGYISYSLDRCSEIKNGTKIHGYSCYIFKDSQFVLKNCLFKLCNSTYSLKLTKSGGHPFVIIISLILIISAFCFLICVYRRNILSVYRVRVFMASVLGRYQPDWLRDVHNRTQIGTVGGTGFINPIYTPLESRY